MPDRVERLGTGEMYALACADRSIREILIASALFHTLDSGRPAVLVSSEEPGELQIQAASAGFDLKPFVQRRQLQILRHPPEAALHVQRVGAKRFIDELDRAGLAPESLILFDQADPLCLLGDPHYAAAAMRIYSSWARANGHTLVSVFDSLNQAPREFVTLMSLASIWSGFAQVSWINQRLLMDVRHWSGEAENSPGECFELRANRRGPLSASSLHYDPQNDPDESESVDLESTVISMRGAFDADARSAMSNWRWPETSSELLLQAKSCSVLTVVLQFGESSDFENLCSDVVALRQLGNCALRIVVRERQARLRMPMAMTLFRIGVSLILAADTSDTSARLQIEALQGTRMYRQYDSNIIRVQRELKTILESDPRDTVQFRWAVEHLLAQAEPYKLEHALVRLYLKPGMQGRAIELLTREGRDLLISLDGSMIWLFLFACERSQVRGMLERVFADALNDLFNDRAIIHEPPRMLAALEGIRLPQVAGSELTIDYARVPADA